MSRIRSSKGLALAAGIISLLCALYCVRYATSLWFEVQLYELMYLWDPSFYIDYTRVMFRLMVVAIIGVLGLVQGIVVLVTRPSLEENLMSVGIVWIIFGIIGLPTIGGLFAIIAGGLALTEHRATGGMPRPRPSPVRPSPHRAPYTGYSRRVVCPWCNAVGDAEDLYCAVCGERMKG
ncbi:MAG: hypothetical protein ACFFCO_08750 [Promethearchaeota archaeon]